MSVRDVETYWAQELGETVEIVPMGWTDEFTDYGVYINGSACYTDKSLAEIEKWLGIYSMLKGS
jgi:hypothetical protein